TAVRRARARPPGCCPRVRRRGTPRPGGRPRNAARAATGAAVPARRRAARPAAARLRLRTDRDRQRETGRHESRRQERGESAHVNSPVGDTPSFDCTGCATPLDRKSTRLNSSHVKTSYAVFCLKKKITTNFFRKETKDNLTPIQILKVTENNVENPVVNAATRLNTGVEVYAPSTYKNDSRAVEP